MHTAIIVDDEAPSRSVLKKLLLKFCPSVEITGEADNAKEAYGLICKLKPDVVFLDLQMPGGNGFSLLKKFKEIDFEVIFVTSYDKYAIEAIKLSALHYLLKPIEVEDLKEAVNRLEKKMYAKEINEQTIANAVRNSEEIEKKLTVHIQDYVVFLSLNDITHLEASVNYTFIYMKDGAKYTSSTNIGEYEKILNGHLQFYRISKSCIVNVNSIKEYTKGEVCLLNLENSHSYEVSRRRKQELIELLKLKVKSN
jgi:two-component system LytT family response regulator